MLAAAVLAALGAAVLAAAKLTPAELASVVGSTTALHPRPACAFPSDACLCFLDPGMLQPSMPQLSMLLAPVLSLSLRLPAFFINDNMKQSCPE
jgi:hypothetical protein